MGCGDEKLLKYLTQTFIAYCNAMICQQVTLSGDAEWPKVADAVIEATLLTLFLGDDNILSCVDLRAENRPECSGIAGESRSCVAVCWCGLPVSVIRRGRARTGSLWDA